MKKLPTLIISFVSAAVVLGSAAVMAGPVYDAYFSDKTAPNIRFMGENVGGLSEDEVKAVVEKVAAKEFIANIDADGTKISLDIGKSGIILDKEASVDNIKKAGKNSLPEAFKARKGIDVEPVFEKDEELFQSVINAKLAENNAGFFSYVVDIGDSSADYTILTDSLSFDYGKLMDETVSAVIENKLDKEIVAPFKEFEWPDAEDLRKDFDISVQNAEMTVEDGKAKYKAHVVGRELDIEVLKENLKNKNEKFTVPYKKILPSVYTQDLGDELFPDLLGKYTTYYSEGNVARSSNVKLAASKINGYIMNHGDVFSFNKVVGNRTYANGFKDAAVYSANGVENGVGGGICQVSSTLYPAVLYSDLGIVERRNHSYTVAYAKPGLDATVSYGTIDFRFKNTNQNPIKISAVASGGAMTVRIYGTKQNDNTVVVEATTLKTTPRGEKKIFDSSLPLGTSKVDTTGFDGATAQVFKYIKASDGTVLSSSNLGISNYIPLSRIIKYNDGVNPEEEKTEVLDNPAEPPVSDLPQEENTKEEQSNGESEENFDDEAEEPLPSVSEEPNFSEDESVQAQLPNPDEESDSSQTIQQTVLPEVSDEVSESENSGE